MSNITGIELGPESCVLVSARQGSDAAQVSAVHVLDPLLSSAGGAALTAALMTARRTGRFPRSARVVSWGLAAPAAADDPASAPLVKPIADAGFRVEAILTPAEALARLAATRRRANDGPAAWLSINTHGAAIAIVNGMDILFSRTLSWSYRANFATVREQLLQRYSLVAHIAPELQRGIALVRAKHGLKVDTAVTCGNLPDLRSLTMPLIEELDLEVETLDSIEGLQARGVSVLEKFAEAAPAIRLACAAAVMPSSRRRSFSLATGVAAALVVGAVALGASLMLRGRDAGLPGDVRVTVQGVQPERPVPERPLPAASTGSGQASMPVAGLGSRQEEPRPAATSEAPVRPVRTHASTPSAPAQAAVKKPLPPVPPLTSILIDGGRRLAMFGGVIVGVGDAVGPRTVVRIDQHLVVLREPSGAQITVALRPLP